EQPECGDGDAEYAAGNTDHADFDQVLAEYHLATRAERAAQADDRRGAQEFREQQPDHVQQANRQEHEREPDQHAVVVLDHFVDGEPPIGPLQPIVERTLETAESLLLASIVVDEALIRLDVFLRRQLHPVLQPHALAVQEVAERIDRLVFPAIDVAARSQLQLFGQGERSIDILRLIERAVVEIVDLRCRQPIVEHTADAELAPVELERAPYAVHASEHL